MPSISALQQARASYEPKLPPVLLQNGPFVDANLGEPTESVDDQGTIKGLFPNTYGLPVIQFVPGNQKELPPIRVGVILSGGQAPGGHNVIAGLFDGLKGLNEDNELYGFLGGPSGLIDGEYKALTEEIVDEYRNTGGFDLICSGRTKLDTEEKFEQVAANCKRLGVSALVVIGGDDSNTNACTLAEYMAAHDKGIQVIGCPKTIDGDLRNEQIEVSFGFDTATKVYSELIGNIMRDANSARKYWHFIKVMGRSASHIALECALQTHPTACIISEEVAEKRQTLGELVDHLADIVRKRAAAGMNFGIVIIPEGLIEFIPEVGVLMGEINELVADGSDTGAEFQALDTMDEKIAFVTERIDDENTRGVFTSLPDQIQAQLLGDRDPHGNVQVSKIETEKLFAGMVETRLAEWRETDEYDGAFSAQTHFFGYEGRCAAPSNFDADYCYGLGYTAAALLGAGKTAYMASIQNLSGPASEWEAGGIPLTMMMNMERRHGEDVPVIRKALVELEGKPFRVFAESRDAWSEGVEFLYPGPIQYFGPAEVCDQATRTLVLERT
ncbi:MAG: diphosphate--fructose-6-phosphate 1-phosphotransferase [Lentisphaeria bacterium]|nr:diphosphate--fructose-6-phosphate 1-phosphotransferase [Lentisphaeria bacterium]